VGCNVKDIASQLIEASPTLQESLMVAMGGGCINFLPDTFDGPENKVSNGARKDGRNPTKCCSLFLKNDFYVLKESSQCRTQY